MDLLRYVNHFVNSYRTSAWAWNFQTRSAHSMKFPSDISKIWAEISRQCQQSQKLPITKCPSPLPGAHNCKVTHAVRMCLQVKLIFSCLILLSNQLYLFEIIIKLRHTSTNLIGIYTFLGLIYINWFNYSSSAVSSIAPLG
jgi:hypothetical protein